jgi:SAM-dependent methyltransferase
MGFTYNIQHRFDICSCFIESLISTKAEHVLDLGPGDGEFSHLMLDAGFNVTAIGNEESDGVKELKRKYANFKFIDKDLNDYDFSDLHYKPDGIFASHVMEHLYSPFDFLVNCNAILRKNDGLLCIIVPPYKHQVVDNHTFVGWNVGHLMTLMLRAGINIKDGRYHTVDYNVVAIVSKGTSGVLGSDVPILTRHADLFPPVIQEELKRNKEHFNGEIKSINW